MMNAFDRDLFVDSLIFQGSSDGSTWTGIDTVSQEIHEGFNYLTYDDEDGETMPRYQYYRFYNSQVGGCEIGEIEMTGWVVLEDDQSSMTCTPSLTYGETTISVAESTVTYEADATVVISDISPRWGSVLGSETITFTVD
jgi:hypothetical protein